MGLAEMLAMAARDYDGEDTPKILPEAAIMRMREFAVRYAEMLNGPRFSVGQIVTPVKGGIVKGEGEPHLVIEIFANAAPFFSSPDGSSLFGMRADIRVLSVSHDCISPFWVESYGFELWTGDDKSANNRRQKSKVQ